MQWNLTVKCRSKSEAVVESMFLKRAGMFLLELAKQLDEASKTFHKAKTVKRKKKD